MYSFTLQSLCIVLEFYVLEPAKCPQQIVPKRSSRLSAINVTVIEIYAHLIMVAGPC